MSNTIEYKAYSHAKSRCNDPNHAAYKWYGGRGIEFRFKSFEEFIEHIGLRPSPKHSLDRINNNGHYEVGNVRWATKKEQMFNRRPESVQRRRKETRGYFLNPRNLSNPWHAEIVTKGVKIFLGYYPTEDEAHQAYLKAKGEI